MADPPATPFWDGYERSPDTVDVLVEAVRAALYAHPNQRLGQLITNAIGDRNLFSIYDEALARSLVEYASRT